MTNASSDDLSFLDEWIRDMESVEKELHENERNKEKAAAGETRTPRRLKVFFSYPHDVHQELVERLKADLESRGHEVWFDGEQIKAGDDWRAKITRGIQDSDRGVAFLSKHSTRDPGVCLNEIAIGLDEKGGEDFWVSTLVEPLAEAQPPVSITAVTWLQCLDMQGWQEQDPGWYRARFEQLARIIENPADATRDADIERLRRVLRPLAFAHELGRHVGGFVGRQWVFDEIDAWLDGDRRSRVYRIEGGPGLGKTALALNLTHRARSRVIAVHLCRFNQGDSKRAASMVTNLAYQLATRLPDYRARLLRQPMFTDLERGDLGALGSDVAGSLWRELIAGPLAGQMPRQRLAIVIDALDEAHDSGQNDIVSLLAQGLEQLPAWVGVVLTGRPDPDVVHRLARYRPTLLRSDDPRNRADLKQYLDAWLAPLVDRGELDADQRQAAERRLLERSDGNFLYLRRVREAVELRDCSLKDPERLPGTLIGTYTLFFECRFGADPSEPQGSWRGLARPLLELVLASPEPLPLVLARRLLGWDDDAEADTLGALGSLFPRQAGRIAPFHNSVRDWLEGGDKAGAFRVNPGPARTKLAQMLWAEHADNTPEHPEAAYARAVLPELLPRLNKTGRDLVLGTPTSETAKRLLELADAQAPRGKFALAEGMWRLAVDFADALHATNPTDPRCVYVRWYCSYGLGTALQSMGRLDAAYEAGQRSLTLAEDMAVRDKISAKPVFGLAMSLLGLGRVLFFMGRSAEALNVLRRGAELAEARRLSSHIDKDPDILLFPLASLLLQTGCALTSMGHVEDSLSVLRRGVEISDLIAERFPKDAAIVQLLSSGLYLLGNALAGVGKTDQAFDSLQRGLTVLEPCLERSQGQIGPTGARLAGLFSFGDLLREQGQFAKALDCFQDGVKIAGNMATRFPDVPDFLSLMSWGLIGQADTLVAMGRGEEALSSYRLSLNIWEKSPALEAASLLATGAPLLTLLSDGLCSTLATLGRADEALEYRRRTLAIAEDRYHRTPDSLPAASQLAAILLAFGKDAVRDSRHESAGLAYMERSLKIAEDLSARSPLDYEFACDLCEGQMTAGDLLLELGRTDISLDWYQRSFSLVEEITVRFPDRESDHHSGLLVHAIANKLTMALLGPRRLGEAHDVVSRSLCILERLIARTPEDETLMQHRHSALKILDMLKDCFEPPKGANNSSNCGRASDAPERDSALLRRYRDRFKSLWTTMRGFLGSK